MNLRKIMETNPCNFHGIVICLVYKKEDICHYYQSFMEFQLKCILNSEGNTGRAKWA